MSIEPWDNKKIDYERRKLLTQARLVAERLHADGCYIIMTRTHGPYRHLLSGGNIPGYDEEQMLVNMLETVRKLKRGETGWQQ